MTPLYQLDQAGFSYGPARVLSSVTLDMPAGCLVALTGPNGAGKSTLLGIMADCGIPERRCLFRSRGWKLEARRLRPLGQLRPQSLRLEFPFTAEQVVFMGGPLTRRPVPDPADIEAARKAMDLTMSPPSHSRFPVVERRRTPAGSAGLGLGPATRGPAS
jgi:ABC-type Mn2+/Zn2+ transport system ATPase subunit